MSIKVKCVVLEKIYPMPLKCRKSIYFDDDNIRDLIFKGYVIPYKVDKTKNKLL